jgi:hypothetical protein
LNGLEKLREELFEREMRLKTLRRIEGEIVDE